MAGLYPGGPRRCPGDSRAGGGLGILTPREQGSCQNCGGLCRRRARGHRRKQRHRTRRTRGTVLWPSGSVMEPHNPQVVPEQESTREPHLCIWLHNTTMLKWLNFFWLILVQR